MAYPEAMRRARYEYSLSRQLDSQQRSTPMAEDIFKFSIRVSCQSTDTNSNSLLLYRPIEYINCQSFFQEGQSFLRSVLSHPLFPAESLNQIIDGVISQVRRMFHFDQSAANAFDPLESQPQEFSLNLVVVLYNIDDMRLAMENSIQSIRMIPASNKAIQTSVKKSKVVNQNGHCTICMEEFHVNDDGMTEGYTMPCNHMFHQQCIVSWLQTSHMCPLCRYPLSTVNE